MCAYPWPRVRHHHHRVAVGAQIVATNGSRLTTLEGITLELRLDNDSRPSVLYIFCSAVLRAFSAGIPAPSSAGLIAIARTRARRSIGSTNNLKIMGTGPAVVIGIGAASTPTSDVPETGGRSILGSVLSSSRCRRRGSLYGPGSGGHRAVPQRAHRVRGGPRPGPLLGTSCAGRVFLRRPAAHVRKGVAKRHRWNEYTDQVGRVVAHKRGRERGTGVRRRRTAARG